jgi:hypothetical protein
VTTAFLTGLARKASAVSFILTRTMAEISSAWKFLYSPLYLTTILGFYYSPASTLKGQSLQSFYTRGSSNFLPINLLASKTVFSGFLAH